MSRGESFFVQAAAGGRHPRRRAIGNRSRRTAAIAVAFVLLMLLAQGATGDIRAVSPERSTVVRGQSRSDAATVEVETGEETSSCLEIVDPPDGVVFVFDPACGEGAFDSTLSVEASDDAATGEHTIKILEVNSATGETIDEKSWILIVRETAGPTTTTTFAPHPTTTTFAPPPTSDPGIAPLPPPPDAAPTTVPPTGTAPPGDPIDAIYRQLRPGKLVYSYSSQMDVGRPERFVVRISRNPGEELDTGLPGDESEGTVIKKVSATMSAALAGEAFEVTPLTDEEQVVPAEGFTEWAWQIVPRQPGEQVLYLKVSVVLKSSQFPQIPPRNYPVREFRINVHVDPLRTVGQFLDNNWQYLVSTLLGSGALSWLLARRRRAPAPGRPAPSPAGSPPPATEGGPAGEQHA